MGRFVYRGVRADHPALDAARNGIAVPGDEDGRVAAAEHNLGERLGESPFTSWTHILETARVHANAAGPGGVILVLLLGAPAAEDRWSWEWSPDLFYEGEVLLRGIRSGAEVLQP